MPYYNMLLQVLQQCAVDSVTDRDNSTHTLVPLIQTSLTSYM